MNRNTRVIQAAAGSRLNCSWRKPQRTARFCRGGGAFGLMLTMVPFSSGCGTNIETLLLDSGAALGRAYLDQLLTDFTNALADQLDQSGQDTGGLTGGGDTTDGDGDTIGGDPGALTGDVAAGQTVFESNGCASCHCADAGGGCALSAPNIMGVATTLIDDNLRGSDAHPVKPPLSDQQIADLAAYLASL